MGFWYIQIVLFEVFQHRGILDVYGIYIEIYSNKFYIKFFVKRLVKSFYTKNLQFGKDFEVF